MRGKTEWNVLPAGPELAADKALRRRLSGDDVLSVADSLERASTVMVSGEVDVVLSEQQYADGRGVDFLQRMRVIPPATICILVLANSRREEIIKAGSRLLGWHGDDLVGFGAIADAGNNRVLLWRWHDGIDP